MMNRSELASLCTEFDAAQLEGYAELARLSALRARGEFSHLLARRDFLALEIKTAEVEYFYTRSLERADRVAMRIRALLAERNGSRDA